MIYTIENDYLVARIKQHGAELCSLKSKKNDTELIWQAEKSVWSRHAPILFPIVGKLKDNTYKHNGKAYQMSQHGFARNADFEAESAKKHEINFSLTENEKSLQEYPFKFKLYICYKLDGNNLKISYEVVNTNSGEMYFSIGGHPGFRCPITNGKKREDYSLEFNKRETASTHLLENGNFSGETESILVNTQNLQLAKSTFDKDALVFKGLESESVSFLENGVRKFTFQFPDFPYLGIWSKSQTSEFVCIEPWFGLADSASSTGELAEKEGIIKLEKGKTFNCEYVVSVEPA